jgi:hypothetical protein
MNEETSLQIEKVILKDVKPSFGGRNLYIDADGTTIVQVVDINEDIEEKRYEFSLTEELRDLLHKTIENVDYFNLSVDESKEGDKESAIITMKAKDGRENTVKRFKDTENARFYSIHESLIAVVKYAEEHVEPFYEGAHEIDWTPDAFS